MGTRSPWVSAKTGSEVESFKVGMRGAPGGVTCCIVAAATGGVLVAAAATGGVPVGLLMVEFEEGRRVTECWRGEWKMARIADCVQIVVCFCGLWRTVERVRDAKSAITLR
jgi:hypothetical protein